MGLLTPRFLHNPSTSITERYISFEPVGTEPHTVILCDETLILSGSHPGGPIQRFIDPGDCVQAMIALNGQ